MAKVRMGFGLRRDAIEQTRLESSPPESRKPSGASESRRLSTAWMSSSRMCFAAVSSSSAEYSVTVVRSQ